MWLWAFPPNERNVDIPTPLAAFPDPAEAAARARGTRWAANTVSIADRILSGHLPLLGTEFDTGSSIAWRRDYQSGVETAPLYFRRIPYLDATRAGDHKLIWEMSRHQHLVLVAQAFLLTGEDRYREYVFHQLEHWWQENPFQGGINWASALEVAFRALSWIWIYHLIGAGKSGSFRARFLNELARHGYHLEYNLSVYFSPNTHLLGEAVVLHAIGALFPQFRRAAKWRSLGRSIVLKELDRQMHADGSHFEQSTYYHVYAVDFFVLHHLLEPLPQPLVSRLDDMARFLAAITGPSGLLPFFGDDDGGRLFHPFGPRNGFARATLATCSVLLGQRYGAYTEEDLLEQALWWIGPKALGATPTASGQTSVLFPNSGLAAMSADSTHVVIDAGPFGWANAGHSHSDTLSLVLRHGREEILIDPATYTYVGDVRERDAFRGSAAHNTVRIDGLDQADPAGPFRWRNKPRVEVYEWRSDAHADYLHAGCSYRHLQHRRQVWFTKPDLLVVLDTLEGGGDAEHEVGHDVEQFWHAGEPISVLGAGRWRIGAGAELAVSSAGTVIDGWRSDALGSKRPAQVIRVAARMPFPARLATAIRLGGGKAPDVSIEGDHVLAGDAVYAYA